MRLPTEHAARNLCQGYRLLTAPRKGRPSKLDFYEALLVEAIERDRVGSVIPDGYPSATLNGGAGTSRRSASSTERAAVALADPETRLARDPHHEATERAVKALDEAVIALGRWAWAMEALAELRGLVPASPATCEACTGYRRTDPVAAHRGTVGDRLEREVDLCSACWRYVERRWLPGSREGELPTPEEVSFHESHGRWGSYRTTLRNNGGQS